MLLILPVRRLLPERFVQTMLQVSTRPRGGQTLCSRHSLLAFFARVVEDPAGVDPERGRVFFMGVTQDNSDMEFTALHLLWLLCLLRLL